MIRACFMIVGLGHVALGAWNVKYREGAQRVLGGAMLALGALLAVSALAGCYLRQLPITTDVARASTYTIAVQARDGAEQRADAWAIDEHHLATSGPLCEHAENIALLVDHGVMPMLAHVHGRLCLLDAPPSLHLGPPMVLARTWHRSSTHLVAIGSPMWSSWGVVGTVLELDAHGHAIASLGRAELEQDAGALGVIPMIAPPASDVGDPSPSCPPEARARGMCVGAEEWLSP